MTHKQMHTREFVIGAAVGSLLGGVAALLSSPKAGKKIREDICNTYCDLAHRTEELAHKGRSIAETIGSESSKWGCRAKHAVEDAKNSVRGMMGQQVEEEENHAKDFLIGGLAGGIVGAVIGLLLAPKAGEDLRQDLTDTYEDVSERTQAFAKSSQSKANHWLDIAKEVVDGLTDDVHDRGEQVIDRAKGLVNNKRIRDVMDWAALGVRVWQKAKKSKR